MASLKDSLTKGITAINVKTNNFMEESKCKTYITTLENEIRELEQKIGECVYQKWLKGEDAKADIESMLGQIKEKKDEIQNQREKMVKLQMEEKQILGSASCDDTANVVFCSQCGMKNAAHYKFCCKCGTPLKE